MKKQIKLKDVLTSVQSKGKLNEASVYDKNYDQYHDAMGNMYREVSKQGKSLARKFAKAWQSIEDVLENYIGD